MSTVYELEGGLFRKVDRTVTEVGRIEDMLPTLLTYYPIEMGSLPRDTVYLKVVPQPNNEERVEARVIVAQPPQVREILFNESHGPADTQRAYKLAMPYHHFWFNMQGSPVRSQGEPSSFIWTPRAWGVYWTKTAFVSTERTKGLSARLPNMWGDTRVCFGNNPITANVTMGEHINQLVNTYWGSVFNTDLEINTPYGNRARSALARWERETENNSDIWMNWDIWAGEEPIQSLIERVSGYERFNQPAPDSTEPVIPQPPIVLTWHSVNEWVANELSIEQRRRLHAVLTEHGS